MPSALRMRHAGPDGESGGRPYYPYPRSGAGVHDDPRWIPFLESIGKSPEQLAAIPFEVTLPE